MTDTGNISNEASNLIDFARDIYLSSEDETIEDSLIKIFPVLHEVQRQIEEGTRLLSEQEAKAFMQLYLLEIDLELRARATGQSFTARRYTSESTQNLQDLMSSMETMSADPAQWCVSMMELYINAAGFLEKVRKCEAASKFRDKAKSWCMQSTHIDPEIRGNIEFQRQVARLR